MPQVSDEALFIALILGIAVFIVVALLLGIVAIVVSEPGRKEKITFPSLVKIFTGLFTVPKADPKIETSSPSPASEVDISSPQDEIQSVVPLDQTTKRMLGVLITSFLMLGLILAPYYFYIGTKALHLFGLGDWHVVMIIVTIGIVSGGVLGVRMLHASWRQIVVASLCAGAGVMLLSRFEFAPFYPGPWFGSSSPYRSLNAIIFLITSCLFSPPAFLLPLFDLALRQKGPAPSTWKVMPTALIAGLVLGFVTALKVISPYAHPQNFVIPFFLPALLLLIGLIAALVAPMSRRGATIGGFGILLLVFIFAFRFLFSRILFLIYY